MCGICGEIRFDGKRANIATVSSITLNQYARGQDGSGLVAFDNVALGHERLKIFDLGPTGQQPMFDPYLGLAITFNGAIYNYRELFNELSAKGYRFFSNSDTEVLLKAYHCWKLDMFYKLRGMFAFVIWERESGKIILARDPMGVKPLYYVKTESFFRFASTLPALLTQDINKHIDNEALQYYFSFHMVPEPLTLVKSIRKLEPGSVMMLHPDGKIEQSFYWQFHFNSGKENPARNENEWVEALEDALIQSIKRRMVGDVPVGILLSGGLDSSLLTALVANITNETPLTFAIGFESTSEQEGNEFYYSDIVANHFSSAHRKILIEAHEMHGTLNECVASMSEPIASHDAIGFYLLSKEVRQHVKVVLSGQGADELFAGYHWFQGMNYPAVSKHAAAVSLYKILADNSYEEYSDILNPKHHNANLVESYLQKLCHDCTSSNTLDMLQQYESTGALANGPLARVDNMTMAWNLEAREPFLDQDLVKLACQLPALLKVQNGGKYLLRKVAEKFLPDEIIKRPKGYFPVPRLKNLQQEEIGWIRNFLSPDTVRRRGLFNPSYVEKLLNNPERYTTPLGMSKLWQLGILECWLQSNGIH